MEFHFYLLVESNGSVTYLYLIPDISTAVSLHCPGPQR